jgi:hypothetical protein
MYYKGGEKILDKNRIRFWNPNWFRISWFEGMGLSASKEPLLRWSDFLNSLDKLVVWTLSSFS